MFISKTARLNTLVFSANRITCKYITSTKMSLSVFCYRIKFLGLAFIILAVPFAYLYFWGGRPDFFQVKVFAIVSKYMETRYFVIAQTNILDELASILFISGIALISFSKEKTEEDHFENLRIKALINALYITTGFWLLSFLFIYGMTILFVSFFVFVLFLLTYNVLFRFYLIKNRRKNLLKKV